MHCGLRCCERGPWMVCVCANMDSSWIRVGLPGSACAYVLNTMLAVMERSGSVDCPCLREHGFSTDPDRATDVSFVYIFVLNCYTLFIMGNLEKVKFRV